MMFNDKQVFFSSKSQSILISRCLHLLKHSSIDVMIIEVNENLFKRTSSSFVIKNNSLLWAIKSFSHIVRFKISFCISERKNRSMLSCDLIILVKKLCYVRKECNEKSWKFFPMIKLIRIHENYNESLILPRKKLNQIFEVVGDI